MLPTRADFLLDESVVFLNHGSFGACPRSVFEVFQAWQRRMEHQPVRFLGREAPALIQHARARIADYLHAPAETLIFVANASEGANLVARSLPFAAGDEVLITDHEYGAMERMWRFIAQQTGARVVTAPLPAYCDDENTVVDAIWQHVTPQTRLIFASHITSPTALTLPVQALCARARTAGIWTLIDGAHAPSQLLLDVEAVGADFYTGNFHKWLSAPKSAAFLYARPEWHALLHPLVISWGWNEGASFTQQNDWTGTRDLAALLSVPAAIDYQAQHDWDAVRARCHALVQRVYHEGSAITGLRPLHADSPIWYAQMVALPLPPVDAVALKARLYDAHRIEAPITQQGGRDLVRVSFQAYNTPEDAEAFLQALAQVLPSVQGA